MPTETGLSAVTLPDEPVPYWPAYYPGPAIAADADADEDPS